MNIVPLDDLLIQRVYLLQKSTDDGWNLAQLKAELANPVAIGFCAIIDNDVVGYLSCHAICDEANLNNIVTDKNYRRKGIANKLLTRLVNHLKYKDVTRLYLEVRSNNLAAISLYEKTGFIKNGFRKNFYLNPPDDAILYVKEIE